mmetsp:Transcript_133724/g.243898  ORF Transcript_133724/g.243898 Transcript_133724/m.243898 type:complete len:270 (+) Transcript_133724:65-874(+)
MAVKVFVSLLLLISGDRAPQSTLETESSFEKKSINSSTVFGIIGHHGSVFAAQREVQKTGTCANAPQMDDWVHALGSHKAGQIHFLLMFNGQEHFQVKVAHWNPKHPHPDIREEPTIEDWLNETGVKDKLYGESAPGEIGKLLDCMFTALQVVNFFPASLTCITFEMERSYVGLQPVYAQGQRILEDVLTTWKPALDGKLEFQTKQTPDAEPQTAEGKPVPPQVVPDASEMFKRAWSDQKEKGEWTAKVHSYAKRKLQCPQAAAAQAAP